MNEQFANGPDEKPRILIVDNNSRYARSARVLLDRSGKYIACTVIDPRRALETARSFKPDLVLVDLIMPQEDGPEVAAQLEDCFPHFAHYSCRGKGWPSRLRAPDSPEANKQLGAN